MLKLLNLLFVIVPNTVAHPLGLVLIEYIYAPARADTKGDRWLFMNRVEDGTSSSILI